MMPFKSKKQMRAAFGGYLGSEMKRKAKEWAEETPNIKSLPMRKRPKGSGLFTDEEMMDGRKVLERPGMESVDRMKKGKLKTFKRRYVGGNYI